MPQIPIVEAQGQAAALNYPTTTHLPVSQPGFTLLSNALAQQGQEIQQIQDALDKNADTLELAKVGSEYDANLSVLKDAIFRDPTITDHTKEFATRAVKLQQEAAQSMQRPSARAAFQAHVTKTFPREVADVGLSSLKWRAENQLATADAMRETLSRQAAETIDLEKAKNTIALYDGVVNAFTGNAPGLYKPVEGQAKKDSFRELVIDKQIKYLSETDPEQFKANIELEVYKGVAQEKIFAALQQIRVRDEHAQQIAKDNFNVAKAAVDQGWENVAYSPDVEFPQDQVALVMEGVHPFIDKKRMTQLLEVKEKAKFSGRVPAIDVVLNDYYSGPTEVRRAENAMARLNLIDAQLGGTDPRLLQAKKDMQTQINVAKGIIRGDEAVHAAKISAGITAFGQIYDSTERIPAIGKTGRAMSQAEIKADKAQGATLVREGKTPQEAAEIIRKNREDADKALPQGSQKVQSLSKGTR